MRLVQLPTWDMAIALGPGRCRLAPMCHKSVAMLTATAFSVDGLVGAENLIYCFVPFHVFRVEEHSLLCAVVDRVFVFPVGVGLLRGVVHLLHGISARRPLVVVHDDFLA